MKIKNMERQDVVIAVLFVSAFVIFGGLTYREFTREGFASTAKYLCEHSNVDAVNAGGK